MTARSSRIRRRPDRMRFALLLAWRESRSPRRLLLLMASVTAGGAAPVAIGSLPRHLRDSVRDQARARLRAGLAGRRGTAFSPRPASPIAPAPQRRADG